MTFAGLTSRWTTPRSWACDGQRDGHQGLEVPPQRALVPGAPPADDDLVEGRAKHQRHREPGPPILQRADVDDRDDRGVIEARLGIGLALETSQRVLRASGGQDLGGQDAVEPDVPHFPDVAHAAGRVVLDHVVALAEGGPQALDLGARDLAGVDGADRPERVGFRLPRHRKRVPEPSWRSWRTDTAGRASS
ncbi:MAG: hypothetical protein GY913_07885 [Proteobacteria bacterium]|nr:hypothetical protein [Pseudomonadota bacterium]